MSSLPASILEKSRISSIKGKERAAGGLDGAQVGGLLQVEGRVEQEIGHAENAVERGCGTRG